MRKFLWALLIAVPCLTQAQHKTNYKISGRLVDLDASMIYIAYGDGVFIQRMDSAKVIDHAYQLKGFVPVGQRALLLTYNFRKKIPAPADGAIAALFLMPGKIKITQHKTFQNITATGGVGYADYQMLTFLANPYKEQITAWRTKRYSLLKQGDSIAVKDIDAQLYAIEQGYKEKVYANFIKDHPESPAAFYALTELAGNDHRIDGIKLKPYFDRLPANIKATNAGKEISKRINDGIIFDTNGAVGSQAPDFTLLDTAGRAVKLSDYKGKYVLLDFWASWCTPCRADNPHLVTAYKQFHAKGFDIMSVSLDVKAREKAWLAAIDHDHLTQWTHVADLQHQVNSAVGIYGISGIPQNFLIGPDGKIIARGLRGGDLEKKLNELLSN